MMKNLRVRKAYELAKNYYLDYGTCSQCVILAVMEVEENDMSELLKAAHFVSGGGCLMGEGTCGALLAGQLVLGSFFGREKEEIKQGKFKERLLPGKELYERFVSKYGGVTCNWFREKYAGRLFDMWDPETGELKQQLKEPCSEMTGQVAAWLIEILETEVREKSQKS